MTVFRCADGVVRLLTGDPAVSPTHNGRDPFYCWDVQVDQGFATRNRREIFSTEIGNCPSVLPPPRSSILASSFPCTATRKLILTASATRAFISPIQSSHHPDPERGRKESLRTLLRRLTYRRAPGAAVKLPTSGHLSRA